MRTISNLFSPFDVPEQQEEQPSKPINKQFDPFYDTSEMFLHSVDTTPKLDIDIPQPNSADVQVGNLSTQAPSYQSTEGMSGGGVMSQPADLGLDAPNYDLSTYKSPYEQTTTSPEPTTNIPNIPMTPAGINKVERTGKLSVPMSPAGLRELERTTEVYDKSNIDTSKLKPISVKTFKGKGEIHLANIGGKRAVVYPDGTVKVGGHRNWRTNNPFNIVYTPNTLKRYRKYGAIGGDHAGDSVEKGWRGLVFKTPEGGARAWADLIKSHYSNYNALTIGKKFQIGMTPQAYSRAIQRGLPKGFDIHKPFKSYTPKELDLFAKAQMKVEGFRKGRMFRLSHR